MYTTKLQVALYRPKQKNLHCSLSVCYMCFGGMCLYLLWQISQTVTLFCHFLCWMLVALGAVQKQTWSIVFWPPWLISAVFRQIWFYGKLFILNNFSEFGDLLVCWSLKFNHGRVSNGRRLRKQQTICHRGKYYIPAIGSDSWIAAITQTGGLTDTSVFQCDFRRRKNKEDNNSILCAQLLHVRVTC